MSTLPSNSLINLSLVLFFFTRNGLHISKVPSFLYAIIGMMLENTSSLPLNILGRIVHDNPPKNVVVEIGD